jgi:pimeloyl-ACP methyl ester carboxylesterase
MPVLRPGLRWLLFGDQYEGADLDLTVRGVGLATLRSIGGFRPSIGAQKRLETLTDLGDVPTTVLVGDRDRLTPPECARSIADALPAAGLTVFPGAGHMLLLERHEDVSATLTTIVQRATKTAPAAKLEEAA